MASVQAISSASICPRRRSAAARLSSTRCAQSMRGNVPAQNDAHSPHFGLSASQVDRELLLQQARPARRPPSRSSPPVPRRRASGRGVETWRASCEESYRPSCVAPGHTYFTGRSRGTLAAHYGKHRCRCKPGECTFAHRATTRSGVRRSGNCQCRVADPVGIVADGWVHAFASHVVVKGAAWRWWTALTAQEKSAQIIARPHSMVWRTS